MSDLSLKQIYYNIDNYTLIIFGWHAISTFLGAISIAIVGKQQQRPQKQHQQNGPKCTKGVLNLSLNSKIFEKCADEKASTGAGRGGGQCSHIQCANLLWSKFYSEYIENICVNGKYWNSNPNDWRLNDEWPLNFNSKYCGQTCDSTLTHTHTHRDWGHTCPNE